ncbi:hypothetical protein ACTXG6_34735 [Pseudonocardia sp. Cha107L01]|uniref:hypothetical protein n=1 Tax=Pseudonocardia sp. Cha107L01 TaxID=3457576 RepID=UPI00403E9EA1
MSSLSVFQRTPQYVVPAQHGPIDPDLIKGIENDYEGFWASVRSTSLGNGWDEPEISGLSVSDEEREASFEAGWQRGGAIRFQLGIFNDVVIDPAVNASAAAFIKNKINEAVEDPATAKKLTPRDIFARRPICCDGYYETYNRSNVELVDLSGDPIIEIVPEGVRTETRLHELDVLIFATGFDAVTGNFFKIEHVGRGGVTLQESWSPKPASFLGLTTSNFPNWFMIGGPLTGFSNIPPTIEVQVDWIGDAIQHVRDSGAETIESTERAGAEWAARCEDVAQQTLFPKVRSWITGGNAAHAGEAPRTLLYFGGLKSYIDQLDQSLTGDAFHLTGV